MADYLLDPIVSALADGANVPTTTTTADRIVAASRGTGSTIKAELDAARGSVMGVEFIIPANTMCFMQFGTNPANADPAMTSAFGTWLQIPDPLPVGNWLMLATFRGGATGAAVIGHILLQPSGQVMWMNRASSILTTTSNIGPFTPGQWIWLTGYNAVGTAGTAPASTDGVLKLAAYNTAGALIGQKTVTNTDTGQVGASHYRIGAGNNNPHTNEQRLRFSSTKFVSGATDILPPPASGPTGESAWALVRSIDFGIGGASSITNIVQTDGPTVDLETVDGEVYFFDDPARTTAVSFTAVAVNANGSKNVSGTFPGNAIAGDIIGDGPAVWDSSQGVWVD